jgi:metal-responsive CopG/Arc/MetJ family transcriptional regulator
MDTKFTERIQARIPETMLQEIQGMAKQRMLDDSDIFREALAEYIAKRKVLTLEPAQTKKIFVRKGR